MTKILLMLGVFWSAGLMAAPLSEAELKQRAEQLGITENIGNLSRSICGYYGFDGNKIAQNVKAMIEMYMLDYEKIDNPTPEQIIQFLNHNKNFMTCGKDNKHYMMVSFEHGRSYDQLFNVLFFDWLLVDDDSLYIDVNVYSFTGPPNGNSPESLMDYLYRVFELTTIPKRKREIKELIEFFEGDLGAKRYRDFTPEQKQLN